jgi:hypothetical protein
MAIDTRADVHEDRPALPGRVFERTSPPAWLGCLYAIATDLRHDV